MSSWLRGLRTPLAAALILEDVRRALAEDTSAADAPIAAAGAAVVPLRRTPVRDDAFIDA